jgi:hypothetical protein
MAITLPLETVVLELTAKAVQGAKPVLIVMGTGQCSFVMFTVCCQPVANPVIHDDFSMLFALFWKSSCIMSQKPLGNDDSSVLDLSSGECHPVIY